MSAISSNLKQDRLTAALDYAALGYRVLPLHSIDEGGHCTCGETPCASQPGKHPWTRGGLHDATTDSEKIRNWWGTHSGANIGVRADALIIDVDDPESFSALLKKYNSTIPDCPTVKTAKGFHLYFSNPSSGPIKSTAGVAGCFDVRGNTTYVVAPPSLHVSGAVYEWEKPLISSLPDAPDWLLLEISEHKENRKNSPSNSACESNQSTGKLPTMRYGWTVLENACRAISSAEEGTRNDTLNREAYKVGGFIAGGEIDEQIATAALYSAAETSGLEKGEIHKTVNRALTEGKASPLNADSVAKAFKQSSTSAIAQVAEIAVSESQWPEPQPIVGIHASEPYPEDALPPRIRDAVREVQGFTQAPLALVASSALGAVSIATQHLADAKRDEKLTGPTSLFLLTIADSGERKSTCEGYFTKPITEYQKEQAKIMAPEIKRFKAEHEAWEAKKAGLLAAIKDHGKKGTPADEREAELAELERCEPRAPKVPHLLLGDRTQESLIRTLATGYPSGGISSSEGGAILGSHSMGNDSIMRMLSTLNVLWDGGTLDVGRIGSGNLTVEGVRLTVSLQIQDETLKSFIDRSGPLARGSGFWARFLTARPQSTQGTRFYKEPPKDTPALKAFIERIWEILDSPAPLTERGTLKPALLSFTPEAKELWVDFHNEVERGLAKGGELESVKDVASKAADNAARLATLFHIFEYGGIGSIGEDAISAGCRLAAWHLNEARCFFNEADLPQTLKDAATLEAWLTERYGQSGECVVPKNEVAQKGPYAIRKKARLDPAIQELAKLGRLRLKDDGRKNVLLLNPVLLETPDAG